MISKKQRENTRARPRQAATENATRQSSMKEISMTKTLSTPTELLEAVQRYFELMYDCDVSKFDSVFHSTAALNGLRDGAINEWTAAHYRDVLSKRESPKSLKAERREELLLVDFASPNQALVKVRVLINGTAFVDHLTYLKTGDDWKIAFKAYYAEPK